MFGAGAPFQQTTALGPVERGLLVTVCRAAGWQTIAPVDALAAGQLVWLGLAEGNIDGGVVRLRATALGLRRAAENAKPTWHAHQWLPPRGKGHTLHAGEGQVGHDHPPDLGPSYDHQPVATGKRAVIPGRKERL